MSFENSELEPTNFTGIVRLFPLPSLVLFPGVMQPLHIFEPRYREMFWHALEGDGLIAMALFRPNWENSLADEPPIHDIVTIGKIIAHSELEDGRVNLLLKGISRAHLIREIPSELAYRMADVKLIHESSVEPVSELDLRTRLLARYSKLARKCEHQQLAAHSQLVEQDLQLGTLIDMIAFSIDIGVLDQQSILETLDVVKRFKLLMELMQAQIDEQSQHGKIVCEFPPEFSFN